MHGRLLPLLPTPRRLLCLWQSLHDPHTPLAMQYDCLFISLQAKFVGRGNDSDVDSSVSLIPGPTAPDLQVVYTC